MATDGFLSREPTPKHMWAALAGLSYTRDDKENMKLEEGHIREIWEKFGGDKGTYGKNTSHICMKLSKINNFFKKNSGSMIPTGYITLTPLCPFMQKKNRPCEP